MNVERLTERLENGVIKRIGIDDDNRGESIMSRLAAYEDTVLTPSDIADLRNFACQLCGKYKTAHEGSCEGCRWERK